MTGYCSGSFLRLHRLAPIIYKHVCVLDTRAGWSERGRCRWLQTERTDGPDLEDSGKKDRPRAGNQLFHISLHATSTGKSADDILSGINAGTGEDLRPGESGSGNRVCH